MKRSTDRILVTHVGSLVRPTTIREVMAAREQDLPYDAVGFAKLLRQEVANVVHQQTEAGVDVISDGEYGKAGWIRYVAERLGGFVHREVRSGEKEFPKLLPLFVASLATAARPGLWLFARVTGGASGERGEKNVKGRVSVSMSVSIH
jgi:methionine synthase II (cobalamin-independent)